MYPPLTSCQLLQKFGDKTPSSSDLSYQMTQLITAISNVILKELISFLVNYLIKQVKQMIKNYFAKSAVEKEKRRLDKIKEKYKLNIGLEDATKVQKYMAALNSINTLL